MLYLLQIGVIGCLQGGEPVDLTKYIFPATTEVQVKVTLMPVGGTLIIYSPGYENRETRFSEAESLAKIPISGSTLCVKALGGPFDFKVQVMMGAQPLPSRGDPVSNEPRLPTHPTVDLDQ